MRSRTSWRFLTVTATVAALAAPSACGSGGGSKSTDSHAKVTLSFQWWGNDDRAKATQKAVDLFHSLHPNITVQTSYSDYASYFQKLSTQVAGGSAPDVFQLDRATVADYAGRNQLADLSRATGVHHDQFDAKILSGAKIKGVLYGLPAGQTTQMIAYHQADWQAAGATTPTAGWTWDQFFSSAQKLYAASGGKITGTTDFGWAIDWFELWLVERGKRLYTDDSRVAFTSSQLTQFWNLTKKFRDAGAGSKAEDTSPMDGSMPHSAFVKKKSYSEMNYDSSFTAYVSATGQPVVAGSIPTDTGKSGNVIQPSTMLSEYKRTKHPREAGMLIDFLANDVRAGKILGVVRGLPGNRKVRAAIAPSLTGADKTVLDYETEVAKHASPAPPPWPRGSATLKRDFQTIYDDVIFGRISVQAGVDRVMSTAKNDIQQ